MKHWLAEDAALLSAEAELEITELGERVWSLSERMDLVLFFTAPQYRAQYFALALCLWVKHFCERLGVVYPEAWLPAEDET